MHRAVPSWERPFCVSGHAPTCMMQAEAGGVSSVCETLLGVFGAVAPVVVGGMLRFVPGGFTLIAAVVCALATAGMVVAVFSPIRTIPASADWERSEA
ncbi:hypothetical protein BBB_1470 [Bifidobacterium bifidum BGN4]|uniref:Uncharacterized protein n=2 Tax=Bifidobacterium bifidum TaxID=1681 RepID=I3WJJ8_BIFBI|nr:hypothetical protein BBB_1470 [Bifidobacterium bifidum BGN4]